MLVTNVTEAFFQSIEPRAQTKGFCRCRLLLSSQETVLIIERALEVKKRGDLVLFHLQRIHF